MLYSIEAGKYIKSVPHEKEYQKWRKKLSDDDYQKVINELNNRIDGSDINTSSWIPGSHWEGTVYEPLFKACNCNVTQSGLFFGLILFELMIERKDVWGFGRYEKGGIPIKGITYFLLNNPPAHP
ncbi:MAG: hypothetical protein BI182_02485 [Acetobacterium sp. MES1]|uniref:Uncharacterized protein n=1 Tax=Acetobacterium wieringae TaxID=52694 RepID=A0A5D0WQY4_9FIRM|nr:MULTISPECIES: hypothetical protein [Acetobacterium]OXS26594.1 MAG: hypothetical protein BI182_02485 [Acetobacterium sp. MES1]TYC86504.1 hypothetical protein FXB42_06510 [Acetobacterium wieringae]